MMYVMPSQNDTSWRETIPRVGTGTAWWVFLRSFFVLAALHPRGMQNYGFAFALYPALRKLYRSDQDLAQAVERHLCCFNSHPYFSSAIVGGALHHEEKVARGEEPADCVNSFKLSLMGPLAAVGDGFFWLSLRPACGVAGAVLALFLASRLQPVVAALISMVFFLVSYNLVHVMMRIRFFWLSYQLGDSVVPIIAASRLPSMGKLLRIVAALICGAAAGLSLSELQKGFQSSFWTAAGGSAFFLVCYALLAKGVSPYLLAYVSTTAIVLLGLIF
jgi:PTS system mannose-specific IID component